MTIFLSSSKTKILDFITRFPNDFGLMGFEMLQSKVNWTSDYPIAVFMGYVIGKSNVKS